jgi:hypothetical protein
LRQVDPAEVFCGQIIERGNQAQTENDLDDTIGYAETARETIFVETVDLHQGN